MLKIKPICDSEFLRHPKVTGSLEATLELYTGLQAQQQDDEFYGSMVQSIQALLENSNERKQNKVKTEL